ncbi:transcriptional regulator (plasmid) [Calothrix sp. NIES-4071]|nr:transcriptional regulator [Calothrix sp. NIES-4071]BAZ64580.1 transcriptional regulator [Calothrix sp. NIES-4105]
MKNIGRAIKLLRTTHNLKQHDLAKTTSLSKSYICELENNNATPSLDKLFKIGAVFNVKVSEVFLIAEWYDNPKIVSDSDNIASIIHPKVLAMMNVVNEIK